MAFASSMCCCVLHIDHADVISDLANRYALVALVYLYHLIFLFISCRSCYVYVYIYVCMCVCVCVFSTV